MFAEHKSQLISYGLPDCMFGVRVLVPWCISSISYIILYSVYLDVTVYQYWLLIVSHDHTLVK